MKNNSCRIKGGTDMNRQDFYDGKYKKVKTINNVKNYLTHIVIWVHIKTVTRSVL